LAQDGRELHAYCRLQRIEGSLVDRQSKTIVGLELRESLVLHPDVPQPGAWRDGNLAHLIVRSNAKRHRPLVAFRARSSRGVDRGNAAVGWDEDVASRVVVDRA